VTAALAEGGCNLGEASMLRLGGNFTIMLMVQHAGTMQTLRQILEPVVMAMGLHIHIDEIEARLHQHLEPDVRISVFGADRIGIIAQVTTALARAGLNILNLESDVAGTDDKPIYVMPIEGQALQGIDALRRAINEISKDGIEAHLSAIDTLVG